MTDDRAERAMAAWRLVRTCKMKSVQAQFDHFLISTYPAPPLPVDADQKMQVLYIQLWQAFFSGAQNMLWTCLGDDTSVIDFKAIYDEIDAFWSAQL